MNRLACVKKRAAGLATSTALLLLAIYTLAGCGSVARPAAPTSPSVSPAATTTTTRNPAGTPAAALTEADSGRTVQLQKGQRISVTLHEAPGYTPWSRLATSDGGVLLPVVDTRAAAARGITLGSFLAMAPGSARVTSSATQDCPQGSTCSGPAQAWTVTVQVT
jgi:predicted secreted protein